MKNNTRNHPVSLSVFFTTEMWERYGFYVIQTLLALYLVLHAHWTDQRVYALVGSFTALTYLSPIVGGWIADHLLGQKRAILTGALVLLASYIEISLSQSDRGLTASLAGIAVGTGLLKPNISSLLGNAYPVGSPKRESGFTIFYMGITTGIILGTTIPNYLNTYFGWSTSFLSAAFGLVIAFMTFWFGITRHNIRDYTPFEYHFKKIVLTGLLMATLWGLAFYMLNHPGIAPYLFIVIALFALFYLLLCAKAEGIEQARQTLVILLLCTMSVVFFAFYFQMFLSLTLFISRTVQPTLLGISFPPPYYVGVQSVGMIVFGCLLSCQKNTLDIRKQAIKIGNKFMTALLLITVAYGLIALVCRITPPETLLSPWLILPAYLMISLGEMLLSPVGLSAVTLLASHKRVSTMMGIFLMSLGIGAFLSGQLASLTALSTQELSSDLIKVHYGSSFGQLFLILTGATLFCAILNIVIKRFMTAPLPLHH